MRKWKGLVLSVCIILYLSACGNNDTVNDEIPENFTVGIICTSGSENNSSILYFDENLNQTGVTYYPYATMGESFYSPVVYEQSLYVVPQGQANKKDEKVILQQDLETFEIQNYSLEQIAIYGLSVDSSAIYAVNNMNGQSFVSRIDRTDRTVKTAAYDDLYISIVYSYQDRLYAFSSQSTPSGMKGTLHCLDPITLEELHRIDISEFGCDVYSVTGVGDILYFVPMVTAQDTFNQVVCAYDISTEEISAIKFSDDVFHILNADDKLYVTHGNLVTGEGTDLSAYEIATEKVSTYDLGMWPQQITIYGNDLYVLGAGNVAKFNIQTMEKQAEVSIPLGDGYYLSGIFSH